MAADTIQGLAVEISADWSDLAAGLDAAIRQVESAGAEITDEVTGWSAKTDHAFDGLGQSASNAASAIGDSSGQISAALETIVAEQNRLEQAAATATQVFQAAQQAYEQGAISAQAMARAQQEMQAAIEKATVAAEEQPTALQGAQEAFEALKGGVEAFIALEIVQKFQEIVTEALAVYGAAQEVETSFALMTGSEKAAADEMEHLHEMATTLGIPLSDLQRTAQQLAAVFGAGDGLNKVLDAAANASAATGRSFDSVASSLMRVEQQGGVSARQLVALGLTWEDLAKTMGVSVEQAQEELKKGSQDAAADVQVLLDTITAKYGEAAATQAQTVTKELQILRNEVELAMEQIGAAIAPIFDAMFKLIQGSLVPAVNDLLAAIGRIPAPLREVAGVFLSAPFVQAAITIEAIAKAFNTLIDIAVGVERAIAAAAGAILNFLESIGINVDAARKNLQEFQTALDAVAGSATSGGAKVDTAAQGIHSAATSHIDPAAQSVNTAATSFGTLGAQSQGAAVKVENSIKVIGDSIAHSNVIVWLADLIKSLQNTGTAAKTTGDAIADFDLNLPKASGDAKTLADNIEALASNHKQLQANYDATTAVVQRFQNQLAAGITTTANGVKISDLLTTALNNQIRAWQALNPQLIGAKQEGEAVAQSFADLKQKVAQADGEMVLASQIYGQALAAYQAGKATIAELNAAYDQLAAKAKAAHAPVSDVTHDMQATITAATNQVSALQNAIGIYNKFAASTGDSIQEQVAFQNALADVQRKASALGLNVEELGTTLVFSLADSGKSAAKGLQDVADAMNFTANGGLATIQVNKQTVTTLESLAAAGGDGAAALGKLGDQLKAATGFSTSLNNGILTLKGSSDKAAQSFTELGGAAASTARDTSTLGSTFESGAKSAQGYVMYVTQGSQALADLTERVGHANAYVAAATKAIDSMGSDVKSLGDTFDSTGTKLDTKSFVIETSIDKLSNSFTNLGTDAGDAINGITADLNNEGEAATAAGDKTVSALGRMQSMALSTEDAFNAMWESMNDSLGLGGGGGKGGGGLLGYIGNLMAAAGGLAINGEQAAGALANELGRAVSVTTAGMTTTATPGPGAAGFQPGELDLSNKSQWNINFAELVSNFMGAGMSAGDAANKATAMLQAALGQTSTVAGSTATSLATLDQAISDAAAAYQAALQGYDAGIVTQQAVNDALKKYTEAINAAYPGMADTTAAMLAFSQATADATNSVASSAAMVSTSLTDAATAIIGSAQNIQTTVAASTSAADAQMEVLGTVFQGFVGGVQQILAPTYGVSASGSPSFGPAGAAVAGAGLPGGVVVQTNVSAGVVAGSNGMNQLADLVSQAVISKLRTVVGAKI